MKNTEDSEEGLFPDIYIWLKEKYKWKIIVNINNLQQGLLLWWIHKMNKFDSISDDLYMYYIYQLSQSYFNKNKTITIQPKKGANFSFQIVNLSLGLIDFIEWLVNLKVCQIFHHLQS